MGLKHISQALALAGAVSLFTTQSTLGQTTTDQRLASNEQSVSLDDWADSVWRSAFKGDASSVLAELEQVPSSGQAGAGKYFAEEVQGFRSSIDQRNAQRQEKIAEVSKELDEHLAEEGSLALSKALRSAVQLYMLEIDKGAFLHEPRMVGLIESAARSAREAEDSGNWLVAATLFSRLNTLLQEDRTFRQDAERQGNRLAMLALYVPKKLWQMRNDQLIAEGEDELPPFNAIGVGYDKKLQGISAEQVKKAIAYSVARHVNPEQATLSHMLTGGLDAVRVLVTTTDLVEAFPSLEDEQATGAFLGFLTDQIQWVKQNADQLGGLDLRRVVNRVLAKNSDTIKLPETALLHEFGSGAMGELDDFSAIIWPHELRRFERHTQAKFVGVGIQIQNDEQFNIKVVTPLEGTPAQRKGIRANDIIIAVDGKSTIGFTLDQAVDVITGPEGTPVTLTIQREGADGEKIEKDIHIRRAAIDIVTVKGWQRHGAREDDWDWYIDSENRIGYIRLTSFSGHTTKEFDRAINDLKKEGLNGLILDLRFNPGGLLSEAVSISNRFISQGVIVSTQDGNGVRQGRAEMAREYKATLAGIPVAVLINEGSASASEIVSGAIQDHARNGDVDAILIGQRSYGKGSVQNVWPLDGGAAAMKVTTQYYALPSGRVIHKKPGATDWGITPDLQIEMLPSQITDALKLRRDADVLTLDENGIAADNGDEPKSDPNDLIEKGIDLQLQTALVLIQSRALGRTLASADSKQSTTDRN